MSIEVLDYEKVKDSLGSGRSHILVGNGFSIGCDPIFNYRSLYQAALEAGLSPRAQAVFSRLGTNNFEGVMRLLDDAHWIAQTYDLLIDPDESEMLKDVEVVKRALVQALATSHLEHTGCVRDERKDAAREFLSTYHNIFTTNYDLLLYWVIMYGGSPSHQDGFREDEHHPNAPYLVFSGPLGNTRGLLYLHGALHLYIQDGELRKHSWTRSLTGERLTTLIRNGLDSRQYPLFVAQGTAEKKLAQIQSNGYLWYCLDKLRQIQGALVVFGHSFSPTDTHIANAIVRNRRLDRMFVGLHEQAGSQSNHSIRHSVQQIQHQRSDLEIRYFDSDSACVWGGSAKPRRAAP